MLIFYICHITMVYICLLDQIGGLDPDFYFRNNRKSLATEQSDFDYCQMESPNFHDLNYVFRFKAGLNASTFSNGRYYVTNNMDTNLLVIMQPIFVQVNVSHDMDLRLGQFYKSQLTKKTLKDLNLALSAYKSEYYYELKVINTNIKLIYVCPENITNYTLCYDFRKYKTLEANRSAQLIKIRLQVSKAKIKFLEFYKMRGSGRIYAIERFRANTYGTDLNVEPESTNRALSLVFQMVDIDQNDHIIDINHVLYRTLKHNIHLVVKRCSIHNIYISTEDDICNMLKGMHNIIIRNNGTDRYYLNLPLEKNHVGDYIEIASIMSAKFNAITNSNNKYRELVIYDEKTLNQIKSFNPDELTYNLNFSIIANGSAWRGKLFIDYMDGAINVPLEVSYQVFEVKIEQNDKFLYMKIRANNVSYLYVGNFLLTRIKHNYANDMPDDVIFDVGVKGPNYIKKTIKYCNYNEI